jgi:uncharacterized protein (DUF1810 family)
MDMEDKYDLQRFLSAQGESIDGVLQELNHGQKWGHWMWYVFPQVKGLGRSQTAEHFAIKSKEEAMAYLQHPILGTRLIACTDAVNEHHNITAEQIFGYPDYLKFRSSMTLFEKIAEEGEVFTKALQLYFNGEPDMRTLSILNSM